MFDLIIRNGKVVDGSGAPWFQGDIALRDEVIVQVGEVTAEAIAEIDAQGRYVTPGFIDIHTHSDESVIVGPESFSKITQGVTTEVIGNCGYSPAPALGGAKEQVVRSLAEFKLDLTWRTFADYLQVIAQARPTVNIYPLVGHGTLRAAAEGDNQREKELLKEALSQGAQGMSTGLIYPPGCYATTKEICELAKIVAQTGGIYTSHIRNEGDRLLESIAEQIEIGENTGVQVEVSHLKAAGSRNHGRTLQALELIVQARERGVDIAFDVYPYTASSTNLASQLPKWVHAGGWSQLEQRLRDEVTAQKVHKETEEIVESRGGWGKLQIAAVSNQSYLGVVGQRITEAAGRNGLSPWELTRELLINNPEGVEVICFTMSQEDVDRVVCHPLASFGSDATSRSPEGILASGLPHPRAYGTFPRILKQWVRERKLLGLEEAIRKMTSAPASRLALHKRGLLRPGMYGDIVIFDFDKIGDKADYLNPHQYSEGVETVLVNGKLAYDGRESKFWRGTGRILGLRG